MPKYVCYPVEEPKFDARMRESVMLANLTTPVMEGKLPNHYPNARVTAIEEDVTELGENLQSVSQTTEEASQTATQALEDAATADGKATQALQDAATADGKATQALEDAVTAQGAAEAAQGTANDAAQAAASNSGRLDALETIPVENFSESFNLSADKANTIQNCTSAIDVTVTILLNESGEKFLLLPVAFEQAGNGVVSIVGAEGVTVPATNKTAGQGKMIVLYEKSLNIYGIAGGVE